MKMLIGGKQTDASDGKTIEVLNPATDEVLDSVPLATRGDIEQVLANARRGFEEWSAYPLHKRITLIQAFVEKMSEQREKLWRILQSETGKTVGAATGCIDGSIALAGHYIELSRTFGGETFPMGNRPDTGGCVMLTVREPLGVIACILPFNFPIDAYMHKVIPSLLMGNAVIIKPASNTPLTDILVTELLLAAGVPGNAVQLVTGSGSELGNWLTGDPRVDLVNLTGSTQVGVKIAANSAASLHRLHLELGGNDPLVILEDADIDQAAADSFNARIGNTGQVCCAAKRFIVHNSIKDAYCQKLVEKLAKVKVGNPVDPSVECGPLISIRAAEELEAQIGQCLSQGGRILCGGKRMGGAFFELTAMEIPPSCDVAKNTELFGPVWSILGFDTIEEAVKIANNTIYGLSAGVIGKDIKAMMRVASGIKAGSCVINGSGAFRSSDQPFGGYKMSGLGREGGKYTLEELTQVKTIVLKGVL
jgi:succinate-semialdehyde dehydrogenase/glutarate-semialdehyde dehydrogenase